MSRDSPKALRGESQPTGQPPVGLIGALLLTAILAEKVPFLRCQFGKKYDHKKSAYKSGTVKRLHGGFIQCLSRRSWKRRRKKLLRALPFEMASLEHMLLVGAWVQSNHQLSSSLFFLWFNQCSPAIHPTNSETNAANIEMMMFNKNARSKIFKIMNKKPPKTTSPTVTPKILDSKTTFFILIRSKRF